LLVCVPITNQIKGYPFEVVLEGSGATGVALADQVKSLDWQSRQAERKGKANPAELAEIKVKIRALLRLI
jgi:mRNA interferase MazF